MLMNKKKIAALIVGGTSSPEEKDEHQYGHNTEDQEVKKQDDYSDDSEFGLKVAARDLMKAFEAKDYSAASKALQEFIEICGTAPKKEYKGED
jgi:type I site-specific restriction-modification system R (restriction) subunit